MKWISIKKKLPPCNTDVLVCFDNGRMEVKHIPYTRPNMWYPGGMSLRWVSHWMELKLPRGHKK